MTDLQRHLPPTRPPSRRWIGVFAAAALVLALAWVVLGSHGFGSATSPAGTSGPAQILQIRGVGSTVTPDSAAYQQTATTCGLGDPCTAEELLHEAHVVLLDNAGVKYRLGPVVVTGADVATAHAVPQSAGLPGWVVNLQLTRSATVRFAEVTEREAEILPPRQIATILDGQVVSAPTVGSPITSGAVQVGDLTEAAAKSLVARLS